MSTNKHIILFYDSMLNYANKYFRLYPSGVYVASNRDQKVSQFNKTIQLIAQTDPCDARGDTYPGRIQGGGGGGGGVPDPFPWKITNI